MNKSYEHYQYIKIEKQHRIARSWSDRKLIMTGLDDHEPRSSHPLAARRKARPAVAA